MSKIVFHFENFNFLYGFVAQNHSAYSFMFIFISILILHCMQLYFFKTFVVSIYTFDMLSSHVIHIYFYNNFDLFDVNAFDIKLLKWIFREIIIKYENFHLLINLKYMRLDWVWHEMSSEMINVLLLVRRSFISVWK